jgi:hypothetical protein
MSQKWFANKGQIIQAVSAVLSLCIASIAIYFVLKSNHSLPKTSAILYVSGGMFLLLIGALIGRRSALRSVGVAAQESGPISKEARPIPDTPPEQFPILEFVQHEWTLVNNTNPLMPSLRPQDIGSQLLTMTFRNRRMPVGETTPTAHSVHAQLTFRSVNGKETFVHHGHWIGRYEHFIDFGPGDSRVLVVILGKKNSHHYALENHNSFDPRKRRVRSGITTLYGPKTVVLTDDIYAIEVALISGETTLYDHNFIVSPESNGTMTVV